jgi:uncharacterized protein (DUF2267 family)
MSLDFEKYAAKGNQFVNLLSEDIEIPREKAGRIIRAVFHALRNRISHEESFHLLSQLPMALKGVYVDGWKFNKPYNRISHINDFFDEIRQEDKELAALDFGNNERASKTVSSVFKTLKYFVSEGEMNNISAMLPKQLREFIEESISGKETIL